MRQSLAHISHSPCSALALVYGMTSRSGTFAIAATLAVILTSPASAVCLARDKAKPGGWDLSRSVGVRTFPVEDEFGRAFIVGTVKVVSVRELHEDKGDPDGVSAHAYRVRPISIFKGPDLPEFTLYNENSSGRFDMALGKVYLVFVQSAGRHSVISNCGWSDELFLAANTVQQVKQLAGVKVN